MIHNVSNFAILSANGSTMQTTAIGELQLSEALSPSVQTALVMDDLKTGTLVSIYQLCICITSQSFYMFRC